MFPAALFKEIGNRQGLRNNLYYKARVKLSPKTPVFEISEQLLLESGRSSIYKMRRDAIIDSPTQRFVIVHYHIFKNGGSTIEAILAREFGKRESGHAFATLHGPQASSTLDARDLERFLRRNPRVTVVSSAHLRYPKPAIRHMVIFDCCFLRHPLERLDSLYRYSRNVDSEDFLSVRARRMNAREFFCDLLKESPHLISNVQVTQIACAGAFTRPAHSYDLERAAGILADMAMPGLVEMFDESLTAAEYFLKPAFPRLSLEYVPRNVTRVPTASRAQNRQERLMRLWGGDVYEDLARLNQFDLELFRRAENEIRRRVALIPDAEARLLEFQSRCAQLSSEPPAPDRFLSQPKPVSRGV